MTSAVSGTYLVLRRQAMTSDAISHSILPGLVAGYFLARGPNQLFGFIGAVIAGVVTVLVSEWLETRNRVSGDSAIGLTFPTMFAGGVILVSVFYPNQHLDADALLFGEIVLAPFDRWLVAGADWGPKAVWVLGATLVANLIFTALLWKPLKITTFDPVQAKVIGLNTNLVRNLHVVMVAITVVATFQAVGAVLAVALFVAPVAAAQMFTQRIKVLFALTAGIAMLGAVVGTELAFQYDLSVSGMIAASLFAVVMGSLLFSPRVGVVTNFVRRRQQAAEFSVDVMLVHLLNHEDQPNQAEECSISHMISELQWENAHLNRVFEAASGMNLVQREGDQLSLLDRGRERARRVVLERSGQSCGIKPS